MDPIIASGYVPGAVGRVTELHGDYYHRHWDFGLFFEAKVATELSAFLSRFDPGRDGFWLAMVDERIIGSAAIVGSGESPEEARLRWLIIDQAFQGQGVGRRLMREALDFCRRTGFRRVYLTTFAGLDAARHLYEAAGFRLMEERADAHWGRTVPEQWFELRLP